jgi:hypothetical protein
VTLNGESVGDLTVNSATDEPTSPVDSTEQMTTPPSEPTDAAFDAESPVEPDQPAAEPPSPVPEDDTEAISEPSGLFDAPGFSLLVGILAVLLFAGLATWRRRSR